MINDPIHETLSIICEECVVLQDDKTSFLKPIHSSKHIRSKLEKAKTSYSGARSKPAVVDLLKELLLMSNDKIRVLRLLPTEELLKPIVNSLIETSISSSAQVNSLESLLPTLGVMLQYTDDFNYSILHFMSQKVSP